MNTTPEYDLYQTLHLRITPQKCAWLILNSIEDNEQLDPDMLHRLQKLADEYTTYYAGSSMTENWMKTPDLTQVAEQTYKLAQKVDPTLPQPDVTNPVQLLNWCKNTKQKLGLDITPTSLNKTTNIPSRNRKNANPDIRIRYNKEQLNQTYPGVSNKTYLKAARAVKHLEKRALIADRAQTVKEATIFGKTRLASSITKEQFQTHLPTARFVAYYVSRLGMRTQFLGQSQARPMDELGEQLLRAAYTSKGFDAEVVSKVLTRKPILAQLTNEQKTNLLNTYFEQMTRWAEELKEAYPATVDEQKMVVQKHVDSSTYNAYTRAYNQARTGWINTLTAVGAEQILETICPPKAMAVVAADIYHRLYGQQAQPDTAVAANLPKPWEVLDGTKQCTAQTIIAAVNKHGADLNGWVEGYQQTDTEKTQAAPDLIHGVTIHNPLLASLLKNSGIYSGKTPTTLIKPGGRNKNPHGKTL